MGNIQPLESFSVGDGSINVSEVIQVQNGHINIKTPNMNKVKINNEHCIPCSEIKKLQESSDDDPRLKVLYEKYCS